MEITQPEAALCKNERLTDARVETAIVNIVQATITGEIDPVTALKELEKIHNLVSVPSPNMPSPLSTAYRLAVMVQAMARVTALTPPEAIGTTRYDTRQDLIIAQNRTGLSGDLYFVGREPASCYQDETKRNVLLNSIDLAILKRELEELEKVISRGNDWGSLIERPMAIEQDYTVRPFVEKNALHLEAEANFSLAWEKNKSPNKRHEHLMTVFQQATAALQAYNTDPTSNPLSVADCKMLYAKTLHDLADLNEFGEIPNGNNAARDVAIELLWEASDATIHHTKPTEDTMFTPLKDWTEYSTSELHELRNIILDYEKYLAARKTLADIEYFRGLYTQEMRLNPNEHLPLKRSKTVLAIGGSVVNITFIGASGQTPAQPTIGIDLVAA